MGIVERNKEKIDSLIKENEKIKTVLTKKKIPFLNFGFYTMARYNSNLDEKTNMYFSGKLHQLVIDENLYLKSLVNSCVDDITNKSMQEMQYDMEMKSLVEKLL